VIPRRRYGPAAVGLHLRWRHLAGFVVVAGLLVMWIHDSLLLNVLMLVHPIESVKAWQLGHVQ